MVLGVALSGAAHAGSYMRSGGELSYSTSAGYIWATRQWDEQGDLQSSSCRKEHTYNSHYLEYGESYYHTLFGGAQLAQAHCGPESNAGIGDLRLGVRGRTDPYRNHRTWELTATLPVQAGGSDSPRLGCGALGLSGALARKDELLPTLALSSGLGVQLWEGPLVHQLEGELGLSGPLPVRRARWGLDLSGRAPLEGGAANVNSDISDCGTGGKHIRAGLSFGASLTRRVYASCGYTRSVWGEDATLSQGFSCGISRLWE